MTQSAFELLIVSAGVLVTLALYAFGFFAFVIYYRRCYERELKVRCEHVRCRGDVA